VCEQSNGNEFGHSRRFILTRAWLSAGGLLITTGVECDKYMRHLSVDEWTDLCGANRCRTAGGLKKRKSVDMVVICHVGHL